MVRSALLALVLASLLGLFPAAAQDKGGKGPASYADAVKGLQRKDGLFPLWLDAGKGRVLVELPAADAEGVSTRVIWVPYLRTGLGSNPVGLDRGRNGGSRLLAFKVMGNKVLGVVENTRYLAQTSDAQELRAVEESFADSVVWGGEVAARTASGGVLVDLTSLLTSDPLNIARDLKRTQQGDFKLDAARSAPDVAASLAFPENLELEALLTFQSAEPGPEVRATAPIPEAVSLTLHHSFVRLPGPGFKTRYADPRAGLMALYTVDYSTPLTASIERPLALRYRLEKADPNAAVSPPKKPIVFYVDSGAPEPVRSALVDGVGWWNQAFEAAGFQGAFRVELLPPGAHPLDARYNVVQWVHRQTRGWSYGSPIYDPRTGEIVKSVITLGSLRVRQDRRIFEGLTDARHSGSGGPNDPIQVALARIRQLGAHEVGHGLGFPHNMAASTYDRGSVMDYPAPLVEVTADGRLDLSNAYSTGMGAWDLFAARYLYSEFPPGTDEAAALENLLREARAKGWIFVSDEHSRPIGAAHPEGNVWDNGPDPVAELERTYRIRRLALSDFGVENVPLGRPMAELKQVLVPIYLYHRYQTAAAAKLLGGERFDYAAAGDGAEGVQPVAAMDQRRALNSLVKGLDPEFLLLPERVIRLLEPHHDNWWDDAPPREVFESRAGSAFDEQAAASAAASLVFDSLLEPGRLARMAQQHARDSAAPSPDQVLDRLTAAVFTGGGAEPARQAAIRGAVQDLYVSDLIRLAADPAAAPATAALAEARLSAIRARLNGAAATDPRRALIRRIDRFLERGIVESAPAPKPPEIPPGPPIGAAAYETCWFCEETGL